MKEHFWRFYSLHAGRLHKHTPTGMFYLSNIERTHKTERSYLNKLNEKKNQEIFKYS